MESHHQYRLEKLCGEIVYDGFNIKNVDEYLANQPEKNRALWQNYADLCENWCQKPRKKLATECRCINFTACWSDSRVTKIIIGFYPGAIVERFADELKDFKTSKGTIQFLVDKPIPDELLKRIIEARVEENLNRKKSK